MKHHLSTALAVCLFSLCLGAPALADDRADVAKMIKSAETLRDKAAALGNEWRFTGKWIKKAKSELDAGNIAEAKKLAERAKFEAETAIAQAATAKVTWIIAVPK